MDAMLRDLFLPHSSGPRASHDAEAKAWKFRRSDDALRVGLRGLYIREGTRARLPYRAVAPVIREAYPSADRPSREHLRAVYACEIRAIAPFHKTRGGQLQQLLEAPLPTLVPDFTYGWGPVWNPPPEGAL